VCVFSTLRYRSWYTRTFSRQKNVLYLHRKRSMPVGHRSSSNHKNASSNGFSSSPSPSPTSCFFGVSLFARLEPPPEEDDRVGEEERIFIAFTRLVCVPKSISNPLWFPVPRYNLHLSPTKRHPIFFGASVSFFSFL